MAVGDKIKLARESKGWSQEQLADSVGVEVPTISRWETGIHEPRPRHWPNLMSALGKSREWFEGVEDDRFSGLEARLEKMENVSQINQIPDELAGAWRKAELWRQGLALFFLTGDQSHLKNVTPELR